MHFYDNKVFQLDVVNRAAATIRLDHEHLVSIHGVNFIVGDMMNIYNIKRKTPF
jgi:hypothetical protein